MCHIESSYRELLKNNFEFDPVRMFLTGIEQWLEERIHSQTVVFVKNVLHVRRVYIVALAVPSY